MNSIQSAFVRRLRPPRLLRASSDDARQDGGTAPEPPIVPDNARLIEMLRQVTGQPASVVLDRLRREHYQLGWNVTEDLQRRHLQPFCWSERVAEFYRETDAFLFEAIAFNRTGYKFQVREWIANHLRSKFPHGARILVYGDGAGFDSLYLALAGHQVTYQEVCVNAAAFAQLLFADRGVTLRMCPAEPESREAVYDAILCLDVLEHLPDPASQVLRLAGQLVEGGTLIVHAPFFFLTRQCPTHLRSNLRFSGELHQLFSPANLHPTAARLFWDPIAFEKRRPGNQRAHPSLLNSARIWTGQLALKSMRFWSRPQLALVNLVQGRDQRNLRRFFSAGRPSE